MKKHEACAQFLASAIAALVAVSAFAQAPEASAPQADGAAAGPTNEPSVRDPFWPVGYTPPPPPSPESEGKVAEAPKAEITAPVEWPPLVLKGITKNRAGRYMAMLDGIGLAETGNVVSMTRNGINYRWKIADINDRGITSVRLECVQIEPAPERNQR